MSDTALSTFEIHVPNPNVTDASVALSWCARPEFFQELLQVSMEQPHVYIVVVPEGEENNTRLERRYAVPLQDAMAFVSFMRPGKNVVFAAVDGISMKDDFLMPHEAARWKYHCFKLEPATEPGAPRRFALHLRRITVGSASLAITVPESVFAKQPPKWLQTWVNWGHSDRLPPVDSCEFARRLWGYSAHIQILQFVLVYVLRVLVYFMCKMLLLRQISFDPLLHPIAQTTNEMIGDRVNGSRFLPAHLWGKRDDDGWPMYYLFATPFAALVYFGIISWRGWGAELGMVAQFEIAIGIALAIGVLLTVYGFVNLAWRACVRWWQSPERFDRIMRIKDAEHEARKQAILDAKNYWYRDPEAIEPIVCTPEAPRKPLASLRDLPPKRVTVTLRLEEIKAASCRPFVAE